jgi:hypothetical protein
MSSLLRVAMVLTLFLSCGCASTNSKNRWAGQGLFEFWRDYIEGTPIKEGYRSPGGSFDVHFPISANHVWIEDYVDKGHPQPYKVHVYEYAMFKDIYGYDSKIITMSPDDLPTLHELDYSWVVENLPDIVMIVPTTDTIRDHKKYGKWRQFTFGPYISACEEILYRIEAFFHYEGAIYRVIVYNNVIIEPVREYAKISMEKAKVLAMVSTTKHFDHLMKNLVFRGLAPDKSDENKIAMR